MHMHILCLSYWILIGQQRAKNNQNLKILDNLTTLKLNTVSYCVLKTKMKS